MTRKEIEFIEKEIEKNLDWASKELSAFESSSDPDVRLAHFREYQACSCAATTLKCLLTDLAIYC